MEHFSAPRSSSNSLQLLRELEALSASLDRSPAFNTCKVACLEFPVGKTGRGDGAITSRASELRSRHLSFSYWQSREKKLVDDDDETEKRKTKRGIFSFWKPMRALSHIGKQKASCLFCVEVVAVQSLPASMNGRHLVVCVKKNDSKSGAVRTLPSKVSRGGTEFEETLFVTCHVYFSPGSGTTSVNFEPRPFVIFALAFDGARELDCGRSYVDLSKLIQESIEKSFEDAPIRKWDTSFNLWGKAEGGKVSLKLSFQIMEKDGIGTYIRGRQNAAAIKKGERSCSFARRQSKTSFSVLTTMRDSKTRRMTEDMPGVEYEVVDKGVEVEEVCAKRDDAVLNEVVVKEVMHHHHHRCSDGNKLRFRMAVLDSIAQQIKELESVLLGDKGHYWRDKQGEEEEMITREFIEKLHDDDDDDDDDDEKEDSEEEEEESNNWSLAELGDGLGCVVLTRNEGFLASINPLRHHKQVGNNVAAVGAKREGPRLAMQMSKPLVLNTRPQRQSDDGADNGKAAGMNNVMEALQRMAAGMGVEGMTSLLSTLMPIEELMGKSAEQIAFEGIASQILHQRGKGNPSTMAQTCRSPTSSSSSFMRTLAVVKSMANAMNRGDKSQERCTTAADVLGLSVRKLEEVIVEALKIQAGIDDEEVEEALPPRFDVSSSSCDNGVATLFERAVSLQEWLTRGNDEDGNIDICFVVQLRDPLRQYEVVGGPMLVLVHAVSNSGGGGGGEEKTGPVERLEIGELHVVGILMKGSGGGGGSSGGGGGGGWGGGLIIFPHQAKKDDSSAAGNKNVMWSISSSLGRSYSSSIAAADDGDHVWLKPLRNPNVMFTN
ncbi:unnamed protein product [Cuscuta campestris]|uniref:C2 NT-type domain-containing protein n=1 Tax=Cuscuta campestris TaxID=132261 RepID=A0A484L976_9ASTE|nr:unnamed protein product [Cuscuta campestris]